MQERFIKIQLVLINKSITSSKMYQHSVNFKSINRFK